MCILYVCLFFFKQKTAYEMRISDWSSDVCSSDLLERIGAHHNEEFALLRILPSPANLVGLGVQIIVLAEKAIGQAVVLDGDHFAVLDFVRPVSGLHVRFVYSHRPALPLDLLAFMDGYQIGRAHV